MWLFQSTDSVYLSTFCKIFTQIKYTNIEILMNFLKFQFDILFTKKVLRFKKNKYNTPRNVCR